MIAKVNHVQRYPIEGVDQIRVDFYPEEGEACYDEQHVYVPIIPPEGYPGEVDGKGNPVDPVAYQVWLDSLPHEWRTNPCLCQFIRVPLGTNIVKLRQVIEDYIVRVKGVGSDIGINSDKAAKRVALSRLDAQLVTKLESLSANRMSVRCRSIKGQDAIIAHPAVGLEIRV